MKFVKILGFVIFLTTFYILHTTYVYAQECTNVSNSEFHSLRPYPGKPCLDAISETATFCGDSLTITDNIPQTYSPGVDNCVPIPNSSKVRCTYSVKKSRDITIGLSEAELPIMGNTEDVFNSQNPIISDSEENKKRNISPEERVNNYVSWYLNGIFNRAEYSPISLANPNASPAPPSIVDFSGPINKLLPQEVAFRSRINTVEQAGKTRHNQIVGCTYSVTAFFGLIHIGRIPGPCYIDSIALDILKIIFKIDNEKWRLKNWENKLPPLRSDPKFHDYAEYYMAYQEWRGKKCWQIKIPESILGIKIPIFGGLTIVLCGDDPTNPNFYGTMFSYIPFSSTEDRTGEVTAEGSVNSTADVTISDVSTSFTNATLYFAHMQEATELASTLQDTFVYQGANKFAPGNSVPVNTAGSCKIVDVRSNAGDNLMPTPSFITGNIAYTATFTCDFTPPPPTDPNCSGENGSCLDPHYCCSGYDCTANNLCHLGPPEPPPPPQTCTKVIPITINTTTKTPLADKIWAQLVAGNSSVFRKIFPKLGSGSQIGEVKDIPASTKVTYSGDVSGTGELKFPHIGGISEYFLKGIQTMLRPKGYGEAISFGEGGGVPGGKCKEDVPDSAVPAKYLGSFKSNFISLANGWTADCPGPDNNLAEECYNYVVTESAAKGLNPAFTLTIWLNESGASNYCHGGSTTQDFGINIASLYQNIVGQLNKFLELPAAFKYCLNVPGWIEPMHAFLSRFQSSAGACNPNDPVATQYYRDVKDQTWQWVTGDCVSGGKFLISWPTDNSCP